MDAMVLTSAHPTPGADIPGGIPATSPSQSAPRSWWQWLTGSGSRHGSSSGPESESGAVAERRSPLLAYTAASIVLGLGMLVLTTVQVSLWPAIDPDLPGTTLTGSTGGLLLWLMFGLLGSVRSLRTPAGGHITFHMPFIGAAMILGGPTAGAWVAFLSTIERRELESQPWYGILANHSVLAIAAVLGGLATQATAILLGSTGSDVGGQLPGTVTFIAAGVGALVLAVTSTAMGAVTLLLRDGLTRSAFLEALLGMLGRITALEVALVLVLAFAYVGIGWWTPALIGLFVLLIWDNDPMPSPDPLTGLQPADGFRRRLDSGLGRLRRGMMPGATLVGLDLDLFHAVNNSYGHAVGDEVLREIGNRLRAQARRSNDVAGRLGGDEFALFLPGLVDRATAMRRADEIRASICEPIATSVGAVSVGVSIGVLVIEAWGGVPSTAAVLKRADQAMYHAKREGGGIHGYDPVETASFEDEWLEGRR
jgi:diguanylate cyclase (GGDEF)-like protein